MANVPQIPALPGMTPLGIPAGPVVEFIPATVAASYDAVTVRLMVDGMPYLVALDCYKLAALASRARRNANGKCREAGGGVVIKAMDPLRNGA